MIRPKYETQSRHNSTTKRSKKISQAAYHATAERSGGICEGCRSRVAIQMHHRVYRSRGGLDEPVNLFHCCQPCHLIAHTLTGERLGWSVRTGIDPATVPVTLLVITPIEGA